MYHLSIITPTLGRPSLTRMLRSVLQAGFPVTARDELILVTEDEHRSAVRASVSHFEWPTDGLRVLMSDRRGSWGYPARGVGVARARGTHLAWMDDDDVFTGGALAAVHAAISQFPDRCHVFKMLSAWGEEIWRDQSVTCGNFGMQQFVCPNRNLGRYPEPYRYEADFDFMRDTIARSGARPLFWPQRICHCRP